MEKVYTLLELLQSVDFEQAWPYFVPELKKRYRIEIELGLLRSEDIVHMKPHYQMAWEEVLTTDPVAAEDLCDMIVILEWENDGVTELNVAGFRKSNQEERYSLMECPWEKWLSMPVCTKSAQMYGKEKCVARCILEMTFMGLTNQAVQVKVAELDERIQKGQDDLAAGRVYTLEEVFGKDKLKISLNTKRYSIKEKANRRVAAEKEWQKNKERWAIMTK